MDYEFREDIGAIQDVANKFTNERISHRVVEDEKNYKFQKDIIVKMAELWFSGCPIPEEVRRFQSSVFSLCGCHRENIQVQGFFSTGVKDVDDGNSIRAI